MSVEFLATSIQPHPISTIISSDMPGPRRRSVPQGAARYWDPVPQIASAVGVLDFLHCKIDTSSIQGALVFPFSANTYAHDGSMVLVYMLT